MRVLRLIFATLGSLAALLAIGTIALAVVLYTPGATGRALSGGALYSGIAIACFYAFFRMKPATGSPARRGFDVVTTNPDDPPNN